MDANEKKNCITKLAGPLKRYPHEHLNTALPQADVFNSVRVRCGSSKKSDGHCTGLHVGAGDDQLPINFDQRETHKSVC